MNDRTRWDDPYQDRRNDDYGDGRDSASRAQGSRGSGGGRYELNYGGTEQPHQREWSGPSGRNRQELRQQGGYRQDGPQQGAWTDEDYRRAGDYRGNEWRGERDWGSPGYEQPEGYGTGQSEQREWRAADQYGGQGRSNRSGQPGLGSGSDDPGSRYTDRAWGGSSERERSRALRGSGGHESPGYRSAQPFYDSDVGGRHGQDWYARDTGRAGSQSFAAGYGMSSGANYDQWGSRDSRSFGHAGGSDPTFGRGYGPDYGRGEGRGFLERAGDEIASWFGDEDAARRREQDYRGHGPADYTRSDERIRDDVNDRLTDDPRLDARRISATVKDGEVTLSGVVSSRDAKRRAEDCIDRISGVKHVQNNLRVETGARAGSTSWTAGEAAAYTGLSNLGGGSGEGNAQGGATGSGTTSPGATGEIAGSGSGGSMTGASGNSDKARTTPTSGGTSSQGAGTATTGSSGSSGSKSG